MKKLTVSAAAAALIFFLFSIADAQTLIFEARGAVVSGEKDATLGRARVVRPQPVGARFAFSQAQIRGFETEAFRLINQRRKEAGLVELAWSDEAARVARAHSENMAADGFFGHAGTDGKMVDGRADAIGLKRWRAIGENIAFNVGYANPVRVAVEKWMLSAGHKQNLLNPRWRETGVGIAVTPEGKFYFTQVFLDRP